MPDLTEGMLPPFNQKLRTYRPELKKSGKPRIAGGFGLV